MNDKGRSPEDEVRDALAPDGTIEPLDPAGVIAGARRRRRTHVLATAAGASVAVIAIATGGFLVRGDNLGNAPAPANHGPTALVSPPYPAPTRSPSLAGVTPRPPAALPSAQSSAPVPSANPNVPETPGTSAQLTVASCRTAADGEPGPGAAAKLRGTASDEAGKTIVIADSRYWMACDSTYGAEVSARKPATLKKPGVQDNNAFAVANNTVDTVDGQLDYFWAAGLVPDGVATVRYSFADGETVDAEISNGFWLMRHVAGIPPGAHDLGDRVRVQLLSATGGVLNDVRLNWGTQTCAQISHGC
ncbi:hypothetical protein E0H75_02240 [Kribbella capetownensis]|uniref:Uncharacterized protein n=1 Tax=Kribbella capetownensis TaxID=1572659 RepID=A0A4R0JYE2_9ACTN|nr:hypothetical protein [Kribbella capetownensis]TCC52603.1 hypothetical protein E0H75_02240 [Kribbella capetownensis]